ncbi:MAG: ECF transporter S component [Alicyclobacillus sp.]|nr:ECF transporter S component [Alicyclobacillus sp.]
MRRAWKLRDVVLAVMISVVCGAIYMGWDWLTQPLFGSTVSPAIGGIVNGVWWLASGLAAYIIRKPGVALLAGFASAFFEWVLGSPYGPSVLMSGLVQGGGFEVALVILLWRRWGAAAMLFGGAVGGIGNSIQWLTQYQGYTYTFPVILGYIVLTLLSGAFFAGLLPVWVGNALRRAGVVRNFELGRQVPGVR